MPRKKRPEPLTVQQTIAAAVRRERAKRGWNQEQLADAMRQVGFDNWTRLTVTDIERSDPANERAERKEGRQVLIAELFGLAYAFGVSVAELLWDGHPVAFADDLYAADQVGLVATLVSAEEIATHFAGLAAPVVEREFRRLYTDYLNTAKAMATEMREMAGHIETMAQERVQPKEENR